MLYEGGFDVVGVECDCAFVGKVGEHGVELHEQDWVGEFGEALEEAHSCLEDEEPTALEAFVL